MAIELWLDYMLEINLLCSHILHLFILWFAESPVSSHWLSSIEVTCLYKSSCSRRNFATNLTRRLFDEETRKVSNVAGKRGKAKLNPIVVDYIKSTVFQFFPSSSPLETDKDWAICVTAIDEANRRLVNRPRKS